MCLSLACGLSAQAHSQLAPADEYFGKEKMSPLEITNRISDAQRRGPSYWTLYRIQAALEDWARKYPDDPWLQPREYEVLVLFERLHSRVGYLEAVHCWTLMRQQYDRSRSRRTTP